MGRFVVPQCQPDLDQVVATLKRRAALRVCTTAGKSRAMRTTIIAIAANRSIKVNWPDVS